MKTVVKLLVLVLFQVLIAGAALGQSKGTAAEAKAFAEKAIAHVKAVGPQKAFADFTANEGGMWQDRDLFVIAIGFDGTNMANSMIKAMVGKPQLEMKDANGKQMVKEMIEVSKSKGTGWVDYLFSNPMTKKIEPKSTYVIHIPGYEGFVGVGYYK